VHFDVAIVGGGLIGAACADYLAGDGHRVCLLEAGFPAREASWAGAGILHPIAPWQYPDALHPLLEAAPAEHERCARDLLARTGIDVELEQTGLAVVPADSGEGERWVAWSGEKKSRIFVDLQEVEPRARRPARCLFFPEARHVRSHLLTRALLKGAEDRGAEIHGFRRVTRIGAGRLETTRGPVEAERVLLCAGAWSRQLAPALDVEPVRGQILLYERKIDRMVVFADGTYAVPRRDGRTLFGSTLERAGFDSRPTEEACRELGKRAADLLGFREADLRAAWAGLRPATEPRIPWLGPLPGRPDVLVATGHYRNGILLGPLTGRIFADLLGNKDHGFNLCPFRPPVGAGGGLSETEFPR